MTPAGLTVRACAPGATRPTSASWRHHLEGDTWLEFEEVPHPWECATAAAATHFRPPHTTPHASTTSSSVASPLPPRPLASSSSSSLPVRPLIPQLHSTSSLPVPSPLIGPQQPTSTAKRITVPEISWEERRWMFMQSRATSVEKAAATVKKVEQAKKESSPPTLPPNQSPPLPSPQPFRSIHLDYVPPKPPIFNWRSTIPQPAPDWTKRDIDEWWELFEKPRAHAASRRMQRRATARQQKSIRTGMPIQPPSMPPSFIKLAERKRQQKLQTLRQRAPKPIFTIRILNKQLAPLSIRILCAPFQLPPRLTAATRPVAASSSSSSSSSSPLPSIACSSPPSLPAVSITPLSSSSLPLSPLLLPLITLSPPCPATAPAARPRIHASVQRLLTVSLQPVSPNLSLPLHLQQMLLRTLQQLAPYLLSNQPPLRPRIATASQWRSQPTIISS